MLRVNCGAHRKWKEASIEEDNCGPPKEEAVDFVVDPLPTLQWQQAKQVAKQKSEGSKQSRKEQQSEVPDAKQRSVVHDFKVW